MILPGHVIDVWVSPDDLTKVTERARNAQIGGLSNIRSKAERKATLNEDQMTGQLGQAAWSLYLTGDLDAYLRTRDVADAHPYDGDGGEDLLGLNTDIKTSLLRTTTALLNHRLFVPPRERHDGNVYVLALVETEPVDGGSVVHLIGWASDDMLPAEPNGRGSFTGKYVVLATALYPLPPFRWRDCG